MTTWSEGNVEANGITIHYYRTGDKSKPSILLLHGITDSGQCWPVVARDLAGSYDVIATDARGHGRSSISGKDFSIELLASDAAAVIRDLGLERPYLFGHSMGAITAAVTAANYPDLVRAAVLEDPPLLDRAPSQADIDKALSASNEQQQAVYRWQWLFELRALSRDERVARGFAMNPNWAREEIPPWADSKGEMNIDILEPALGAVNSVQWREVISRIECPILLVTGDPELGAIVTAKAAQEAAQIWKHGKVAHIGGAGHNIHRDRYDEAMGAVKAFLERV